MPASNEYFICYFGVINLCVTSCLCCIPSHEVSMFRPNLCRWLHHTYHSPFWKPFQNWTHITFRRHQIYVACTLRGTILAQVTRRHFTCHPPFRKSRSHIKEEKFLSKRRFFYLSYFLRHNICIDGAINIGHCISDHSLRLILNAFWINQYFRSNENSERSERNFYNLSSVDIMKNLKLFSLTGKVSILYFSSNPRQFSTD